MALLRRRRLACLDNDVFARCRAVKPPSDCGGGIDPVALIVTALASGTVTRDVDAALPTVRDAYAGLRVLARTRLDGLPNAELMLAGYEAAPDAWRDRLVAELEQAGAGRDPALVTAAEVLLCLADKAGLRCRYTRSPRRTSRQLQHPDQCLRHAAAGTAVRLQPRPAFWPGVRVCWRRCAPG